MQDTQSTGPPGAGQNRGAGARHWKRQVERAVRELDPENLTRQVHSAEQAIFLRWQEMEMNPGFGDAWELEEIRASTQVLLSIKIHRLHWPDPLALPSGLQPGTLGKP